MTSIIEIITIITIIMAKIFKSILSNQLFGEHGGSKLSQYIVSIRVIFL